MAEVKVTKDVKREIGDYVHRQNAIARLKKSGLVFPKEVHVPDEFLDNKGNLIIPEDVSEIPADELGRYLSIFTSLAAYYEAIVASADIDRATAARVKDFVEAKTLIELKDNKAYSSVTLQKAARDVDEMVVKAQDWADAEDAMFKLSSALLKGCDRIIFLLSREITRRGFKTGYDGRDYNVNAAITGGKPKTPGIDED